MLAVIRKRGMSQSMKWLKPIDEMAWAKQQNGSIGRIFIFSLIRSESKSDILSYFSEQIEDI